MPMLLPAMSFTQHQFSLLSPSISCDQNPNQNRHYPIPKYVPWIESLPHQSSEPDVSSDGGAV